MLVHAAAGGVGSLVVQIAKAHGAQVVATASAPNRALVESLGSDEFIDYHARPLHDVDLVLDTIGGETQEASWHVTAPIGC